MTSERERKNREELFRLISENPELPIVPMVYYEVVAGENLYWLGSWGDVHIGEYLFGKDEIYFREDDDMYNVEKVIEEFLDDGAFAGMNDEEAKKAYNSLPWIKAIIVCIDLPEQGEI